MVKSNAPGPRWSVDSLVLREGSLYSHGWCADPVQSVVTLDICIEYLDGWQEMVPTQYRVHRPDVQAAHPGLNSRCGYFVHATLARNSGVRAVWLLIHYDNGSNVRLRCPWSAPSIDASTLIDKTGVLHRLLKDAVKLPRKLLKGDWQGIWRAVKQRIRWLEVKGATTDSLRQIMGQLASSAVLIVDHSLGGGANQFRSERVRIFNAQGRDVLVWTFVPYLLRHEISFYTASGQLKQKLHLAWGEWKTLLAAGKINEVEFNNCVGYPRQEEMGAMLTAFKQQGGARLRVYLHDFHMVCPSHFLLDYDGRFCGVPDRSQCRQCLPRINDGLVGLFAARDIDLWRQCWGDMLQAADEIVHFSASSKTLMLRAYPTLRPDQWIFRPHQIPPAHGQFHYPSQKPDLRVAVVGHIGRHKGNAVVLDLVNYARQQQVKLQVIVIGTLEGAEGVDGLVQTGTYQRDELIQLLNAQQVHIALMPSICPETFSYVTHELIQLGVPLISFKIGAQAEAVESYALGRLSPLGNVPELLQLLQEFKLELDSLNLP